MKPSLSQQTFFGYFHRRDGENKIGFKSDISKKLRMQKKKIQTKTNSRNRDNNAYPFMDDVHVNCTHSISFYINLFVFPANDDATKTLGIVLGVTATLAAAILVGIYQRRQKREERYA